MSEKEKPYGEPPYDQQDLVDIDTNKPIKVSFPGVDQTTTPKPQKAPNKRPFRHT